MAQVFHPSANTVAKASIFAGVAVVGVTLWLVAEFNRSYYVTEVNVARDQPVPFSHEHHVSGLGIDCRYCHTSVEHSTSAGMPSTKTCMTWHSQIWTNAEMLEPVRASWSTDTPIPWNRVYDLPDYVYFNHSIHVNAGVGCVSCHGQVDTMPLTWKATPLTMEWCLDCHRAPEKYLRPRSEVFNMDYVPAGAQLTVGEEILHNNYIKVERLTNCSICHR